MIRVLAYLNAKVNRMKVNTLPRVVAFCMIFWGVPMGLVFMIPAYRKGTLGLVATDLILTLIVGSAFIGVVLWYAVIRRLVEAKKRALAMQAEKTGQSRVS